jgi:hypothetical protein
MDKLAMLYYGWHTAGVDAQIIAAKPEILIDNTPAGFWRGNCDFKKFQAAGIRVYSYITAAYDTTRPANYGGGSAPAVSPAINQALVKALAAEGVYGVFIDESNPRATTVNKALYDLAKSMGLSVMTNPGMPSINVSAYTVADFVMTDEHYTGRTPSAAEAANLSKTIVIGFGNWTAQQASDYTKSAWAKGFRFSWHEQLEYNSLPSWLGEYVKLLTPAAPPPVEPPPVQPPATDHAACLARIADLEAINTAHQKTNGQLTQALTISQSNLTAITAESTVLRQKIAAAMSVLGG